MVGNDKKLCKVMDGSDVRFVIPVYQRVYTWKIENCKQLYDDLIRVIRDDRDSHFFGSIVYVTNPDSVNDERLVIDGQQRLTTVSLLLLAMSNLIEEGKVKPVDQHLQSKVMDYIVDKYEPSDAKVKLKHVKGDDAAFNKLFGDEKEYVAQSNLTINYEYFYNRIQQQEISVDELFTAFKKLNVIDIKLNNDDNPQLIFESLNSTGVALSEGDKIRNFILMGLTPAEQTRLYESYWRKIEQECTTDEISSFVRDFLSLKQRAIPSFSKIYVTFKDYVATSHQNSEELLKDLYKYAKYYGTIRKANSGIKSVDASLFRLNKLETTVARPFLFDLLDLHESGVIDDAKLFDVLSTIESYIFRRNICDVPTNALNKIFLFLHREIVRLEQNADHYVDKFKFVLLGKKESGRFPDDEEFAEALSNKQIYLMNSKNKIYLFERLENANTVEDKDVYRHIEDGTYSIEHIMPQHLTESWAKSLGENYDDVHETWLHKLANLTLTGYNSKYSNDDFANKRDMENGFKDSGLRMNQWIAKCAKWDEEELKARNNLLVNKAKKIWMYPETEYVAPEKELDSVSLDEDISLKGKYLIKYSFKGLEQPVESWIEMYRRVLKELHSTDKSVLTQIAFADPVEGELSVYASNKAGNGWDEIDDGIFIWHITSTDTKLTLLRRFFKLYGVDESDLVFFIKDERENENDLSPYEAAYKKLWDYVIPELKKGNNGESKQGIFSGVNFSKDNWVSGFFGVSGCNISCIASKSNARVQLYIATHSKENNKTLFDKMLAHKEEIESKVGSSLIWLRKDESKSSSIEIELKNVNAWNEIDYDAIAQFCVTWSKKFNEIIVPILIEENKKINN